MTQTATTGRFRNVMKDAWTDDAVEEKYGAWYIKMGFCGFNTPANNRSGYTTREKAEATILRYQRK